MLRCLKKAIESGQLEAWIVVVIEVVDADDLVTAFEQEAGDVHADKAGGAGDEDFHGSDLLRGSVDFSAARHLIFAAPAFWNIS